MLKQYNNQTENISFILSISEIYSNFHGWLSVSVCALGIPFNLFIIIVLNKTKIVSFATNSILILIALCDTILMIVYLPFCIHFYIKNSNSYFMEPNTKRDTLFWTYYSLFNIFVSVTLHSITIWLNVYLALYRYLSLNKIVNISNRRNKITNFFLLKSQKTIVIIIFLCFLICLPTYFYPTVKHNSKESYYYVDQSDLNAISSNTIFKASFYLQAFLVKIIPCTLLLTFMFLIKKILLLRIKNNNKIKFTFIKVSLKKLIF